MTPRAVIILVILVEIAAFGFWFGWVLGEHHGFMRCCEKFEETWGPRRQGKKEN